MTSWKEIATHLQVSVKTAQRYETEMGLPVRRLGGRVSISIQELAAWQGTAAKENPWWTNLRTLQIALAVCVALLIGCAGVGAWHMMSHLPGDPMSAVQEGNLLKVLDRKGRQVWEHRFPEVTLVPRTMWTTSEQFEDIDRDGKMETVMVWQHVGRDAIGWSLHCFSSTGQLLWELKPEDQVRMAAGKTVGPPYVIRSFTLFNSPEADGTRWVAATFVHVNEVASTLIVVDSKGKRRGQYWHSGHLNSVQMFDADGDGKAEIVAGGVRHGKEQAVLVAFDPSRVSGANAMPAGDPRAMVDQGPSSEKWTGYIAKSTLCKRLDSFNYVSTLNVANGNLHAHVYETVQMPEAYLIYDFAPGLRLREVSITAAFTEANRKLFLQHQMGQLIPEKELGRLQEEFRVERGR